jgi:hypothetical protein
MRNKEGIAHRVKKESIDKGKISLGYAYRSVFFARKNARKNLLTEFGYLW